MPGRVSRDWLWLLRLPRHKSPPARTYPPVVATCGTVSPDPPGLSRNHRSLWDSASTASRSRAAASCTTNSTPPRQENCPRQAPVVDTSESRTSGGRPRSSSDQHVCTQGWCGTSSAATQAPAGWARLATQRRSSRRSRRPAATSTPPWKRGGMWSGSVERI